MSVETMSVTTGPTMKPKPANEQMSIVACVKCSGCVHTVNVNDLHTCERLANVCIRKTMKARFGL